MCHSLTYQVVCCTIELSFATITGIPLQKKRKRNEPKSLEGSTTYEAEEIKPDYLERADCENVGGKAVGGVKIIQADEDNPKLMVRNIFRHSKSGPRTP